jgi:predicted MPP superfamily phosphohydrolase
VLVLGAAFWVIPASLRVTEYDIAIDVPALKGLRIAVIADLHAGSAFIDEDKLDDVVRQTNATNPDLILLAGDYSENIEPEIVARHLARLQAGMGVFAVLGNHDENDDPAQIRAALEHAGIFVLRNFHVVVDSARGPFALVGVGDRKSHSDDIATALGRVPSGLPALCLTHSPDIFPELPGTCALTVAGDTHGGQVALPLIGRPIVLSQYGQRYAAGEVREGAKTLFVSTGIGTTHLPIRLGVVPEISLLKIQ